MSAALPARPASSSSTGYEDGLGRRTLVFDRADGGSFERLSLRPELGVFEVHLRERIDRLARVDDDRLARPRRLHREFPGGPLLVDTRLPAGDRLADLLAAAAGNPDLVTGGVDLAIGFLLGIFPALDALHRQAGFAHGAIGPGRVLLTPAGRAVLIESIYGDALARLGWSRGRFWRELELVVSADPGPPRFTPTTDILHASLTALMLLLGRPLQEDAYPSGLGAIQAEAVEIAEISAGGEFAIGFGAFLDRALAPESSEAFISAREAAHQLQRVVDDAMGAPACQTALRSLTEAIASASAVPPPSAAPLAPAPPPVPRQVVPWRTPPVMELRINVPAAPPVPAPVDVTREAQGPDAAPVGQFPAQAPVPEQPAADAPDPHVVTAHATADHAHANATVVAPEPASALERTVAEAEAPSIEAPPPVSPVATAPPPAPPAPRPVEAAPVAAPVPEPPPAAPAAPESPRKRKRGRKRADGLRSKSAPPKSKFADRKAPLVTSPPLLTPPQPPAPPQPVFPASAYGVPTAGAGYGSPVPAPPAYGTPPPVSPFAMPTPIAAHGPQAPTYAGGGWHVTMPPAGGSPGDGLEMPMATGALKPAGTIQVKKSEPPARPPARVAPPERREVPPPRFEAHHQAATGPNWRLAAAAVVVLMAGAAAGRTYLTDRVVPEPEPVQADAPPPAPTPARGSLLLTSTPEGARVLIDGQDAGQTPLTLDDVEPGRRVISFVSDQGTVRRTVRVEAGRSAEVDVTVFSGWLAVDAPIVLDVALNGRVVGDTQQSRLMLPPGRHTLTLRNADLGYRTTQIVNIEPGVESKLRVTPTTPVNLNAAPWAEVWIDGKRIGETPIANVAVLLGTREILFRHPELGERKLTPTIKVGEPAAISVDLGRPPDR